MARKTNPLRGDEKLPSFLQRTARTAARAVERTLAGTGSGNHGPKIKEPLGVGEWLDKGVWVQVESSNVHSIKYESNTQRLWVEFKDKDGTPTSTYTYANVPAGTAREMYLAPSIGKFHRAKVRDKYPHSKIK